MIQIKEINAEETYPLRIAILRDGMTLSHEMLGDHENETLHLGLFESDNLVCIGSFMKASKDLFKGSQFQLRGMASANAAQGKGFGKLLMEEAELRLKNSGVEILWCNARTVAIEFYKKLGYQTVGNVFQVAEVGPHYLMFKQLN
jgi:ribosomal protein S18 acetylase RimI-like enzyme